jgi:hypothetical protein
MRPITATIGPITSRKTQSYEEFIRDSADLERGRKVLKGAHTGGDLGAAPYREKQPEIERVAREYWKRRPRASSREVGRHLERCGFGKAETLRKEIAHLKPKTPRRK